MLVDLDLALQHLVEVERVDAPQHHRPEAVAHKRRDMGVPDDGGVRGERLALARVLDFGFQGGQAGTARQIEQVVEHLERLEKK